MKSFKGFKAGLDQLERSAQLSGSEFARLSVGYSMHHMFEHKPFDEQQVAAFLGACQMVANLAELINGAAQGDYACSYDEDEEIFILGHVDGEMDLSNVQIDLPADTEMDLLLIAHVGMDIAKQIVNQGDNGDEKIIFD